MIEFLRVSKKDAEVYRAYESDALCREGWYFRADDDVWHGPYHDRSQAVLASKTSLAKEQA
jgi:hypothetical protein